MKLPKKLPVTAPLSASSVVRVAAVLALNGLACWACLSAVWAIDGLHNGVKTAKAIPNKR
ncbi:MAG: hypothetical protein EBX30_12455 [Betaproteobacteria bacterium]|nr:hypothetical protein [Betaproteobacteria bacterium]